MRLATLNVQNLRLRKANGALRLDGARDRDAPADSVAGAEQHDLEDRRLTAALLRDADADVVALQEVFDRPTLDHFHDAFLCQAGLVPYPHRACLSGNDGAGLDVALLSRRTFANVVSHAALTMGDIGLAYDPDLLPEPDSPIFRRDCLQARIGRLRLFLCHFKAPYPVTPQVARIRRLEAQAVRWLVEHRSNGGADDDYWLVIGDLNAPALDRPGPDEALAPLHEIGVDLMLRLPEEERWTHHHAPSGVYSCPDALLASPALARDWPQALPRILRQGLGREASRHAGPRLPGVGGHRPHASDHAAVVLDLPGL